MSYKSKWLREIIFSFWMNFCWIFYLFSVVMPNLVFWSIFAIIWALIFWVVLVNTQTYMWSCHWKFSSTLGGGGHYWISFPELDRMTFYCEFDCSGSCEFNISKMGDHSTIRSMEYKWGWGTMQWSSHWLNQHR